VTSFVTVRLNSVAVTPLLLCYDVQRIRLFVNMTPIEVPMA
jgi:hypothetical protein